MSTNTTTPPPAAPVAPLGQEPPQGPQISVAMVMALLLKHGFWVVLFVAIGGIAAWMVTKRMPRAYEATMTLNFDFSQPKTMGGKIEMYDPYADFYSKAEILETEFRIIASMRVARQVVADAGLESDVAFLRDTFKAAPGQVKADDIADVLRARTKVEPVRGTRIATITFEDSDPERAQRLTATIAETYIRMSQEDSVGSTGAALEFLNDQVVKIQKDLESSEMSLHTYKLSRNLLSVSINDQGNMLRDEISSFNGAVTQASIRRAMLVSRANALGKVTRTNPEDLGASELLNDPVLTSLRTAYIAAKTDLATLVASGRGANHPDVLIANSRMEGALDTFLRQVRNLQASALREAAVVTAEAGNLKGLLETSKKRALDLNLNEIEYNRLNRATATNQKLFSNVLDRLKEVGLSRLVSSKNVKVLDPPQRPAGAIRPKVMANLLAGAAGGLFLGILLGVARELSDRTLRTPLDLEEKLGLTNLGFLPVTGLAEKRGEKRRRRGRPVEPVDGAPEFLVHDQPTSLIAEAARSIRSNILFMSPDIPPRVLLITSAGGSEGKTTTAMALATTFAQAGSKTLIVDLDLRRPRLHRIFGVPGDRGVTTALLDGNEDEVIHASRVPNLFVLTAGPLPPNPAELLLSEKLRSLLDRLADKYERVIIDSPPVNPVTDAVILSRHADSTLIVVRAFKTTVDSVRHARRALSDVRAHVLGAVLNAVDLDKVEYKYSYYYRHYGYDARPSVDGGGAD